MPIRYTVRRGAAAGTVLVPHRHADGQYVASPDRYKRSYRRFPTAEAAYAAAIANGWGLRMSAEGKGAASLIKADRCY